MPASEVRARIDNDRPWAWLKRRVSPEVADQVRRLDIRGIGMLPETKRVYPVQGVAEGTTIAAQLIGYVDNDGAGSFGVEQAEDAMLAGSAGSVSAQEDVAGRRIADSVTLLREPIDGRDLRLTIDAGVQHLLEQEMYASYVANSAAGVTGVIMDAETGEILGMASYPAYDANQFATTDGQLFSNPAVSRQYEPGSVMKPFTIAAALDAGAITTTDTFVDDNNLTIGRVHIHNADRGDHPYGHGPITPADVLALSNNVGAAKIGLELGGARLYEAFRRFGFGTPTGIELSGEATGVIWNPDGPNASGDLTAAQNAFGQGLSMTAVQLIAGYAVVRERWLAGHAARRRRLDRSGRHLPRLRAATGRAHHASRDGGDDGRAADERDRQRDRRGCIDPGLHRRGQDRHGPDRGSRRGADRGRRDGGALAVHRRMGRLQLRRHPARPAIRSSRP